jgi:cell division protease FtsH
VTTGAAQDIQMATDLARRMITQFGMSDLIGPVAVGDREQQIFLGRELSQRREVSERTAEQVDAELRRILNEAYQVARTTLEGDMDTLHRMANALLERETLDREEVESVMAGKDLPPRVLPAAPRPPMTPPQLKATSMERGPVLGAPPAEPAGA